MVGIRAEFTKFSPFALALLSQNWKEGICPQKKSEKAAKKEAKKTSKPIKRKSLVNKNYWLYKFVLTKWHYQTVLDKFLRLVLSTKS